MKLTILFSILSVSCCWQFRDLKHFVPYWFQLHKIFEKVFNRFRTFLLTNFHGSRVNWSIKIKERYEADSSSVMLARAIPPHVVLGFNPLNPNSYKHLISPYNITS